jgi:hypothetical protein
VDNSEERNEEKKDEDSDEDTAYVCLLMSAGVKVDKTIGSIECDHSSALGDNGASVGGGNTCSI